MVQLPSGSAGAISGSLSWPIWRQRKKNNGSAQSGSAGAISGSLSWLIWRQRKKNNGSALSGSAGAISGSLSWLIWRQRKKNNGSALSGSAGAISGSLSWLVLRQRKNIAVNSAVQGLPYGNHHGTANHDQLFLRDSDKVQLSFLPTDGYSARLFFLLLLYV